MNATANTLPKKPKGSPPKFADARRACRTAEEHELLTIIIEGKWTEEELHEYSRLYFFANNKDFPTALSYRRAITEISKSYERVFYGPTAYKQVPWRRECQEWRKAFRKGGSKPMPPRREGLLRRGRGNGPKVTYDEYAYPEHTEEYRSMIEQRSRDYFKMGPDSTLHPNAWAASQRAYWREQEANAEALRKKTEAVEFHLVPKSQKKSLKSRGLKLVPQHDDNFWGQTLKPHFNVEFPGHSETFREEVAALARKGGRKKPDAHVSPLSWKIACHKHYILVERTSGSRPANSGCLKR